MSILGSLVRFISLIAYYLSVLTIIVKVKGDIDYTNSAYIIYRRYINRIGVVYIV